MVVSDLLMKENFDNKKNISSVKSFSKRKILNAQDMVFTIISEKNKDNLTQDISEINNLTTDEKTIFNQSIPIINECFIFLSKYTDIPYTVKSFEIFKNKLWNFINQLDKISSSFESKILKKKMQLHLIFKSKCKRTEVLRN